MSASSNSSKERSFDEDMDIETNSTEKRSFDEDVDTEMKTAKIETPVLEQKDSTPSAANASPPKCVSAAMLVTPIPKTTGEDLFTDEERLKYTLEFERKY